jgi:prepilin-type N-terminal cleavage/methylation domain-containing protein
VQSNLVGSERRRGFTLVELLTAITISAILVGVLLAGGMKVVSVASNVLIVWEIAQLNDAVEDFAVRFGDYPPDFHDPAAVVTFVQNHFPKCPLKNYPSFAGQSPASALCFWLGGPNGDGFSTDPTNPFGNGGNRIGPFIRFAPNRVKTKDGVSQYFPPQILGGAPYVYFRAGVKGYQGNCGYPPARPYRDSGTGQWINADSFQILSAGQDGVYGSGNHFPAGADYDKYNLDDIANFSRSGTMGQARSHAGQSASAPQPQGKQSGGKQPPKQPSEQEPTEQEPPEQQSPDQ